MVETILYYGSEVWTLNANLEGSINLVELNDLSKIRKDPGKIEFEMNRYEIEQALLYRMRLRRLKWFGHLMRMEEVMLDFNEHHHKERRTQKKLLRSDKMSHGKTRSYRRGYSRSRPMEVRSGNTAVTSIGNLSTLIEIISNLQFRYFQVTEVNKSNLHNIKISKGTPRYSVVKIKRSSC